MSGLLAIPEAAAQLGVSARTVRRLIAAHKIAHFRDGRLVRIPARELERYIQTHTLPANTAPVRPTTRLRPKVALTAERLPPGPQGGTRRVVRLSDLPDPLGR